MILHRGETLFRQGETGPLYRLNSGLLKIVRVHEDGGQFLVNIIVPGETIPHHSLISPKPYFGTAVALTKCEIDVLPAAEWYLELDGNREKLRAVAMQLEDKLRMIQQRIDQLTEMSPAGKLRKLDEWIRDYIAPAKMTDILTQEEIGQLIGLRRETVNRLLRAGVLSQSSNRPAGPKNS